jgi:hypothetical protein
MLALHSSAAPDTLSAAAGQPFRFIGQIQNPGPRAKQRPHIACQLDLPEPFADQPHLAFRPDFALPDIQPFTRR